MTSYDVIRKIKKSFDQKIKIGHAGTLDPFAQGLLIILLGKGTKLQDRIHKFDKSYEVVVEFGFETDTQDITGEVISRATYTPSEDEIRSATPKFMGKIKQIPPKYSAVKVNGKRAYDLARNEVDFKLEPREVEIFEFELNDYSSPSATFKVTCSTGTYIRTLVVDFAKSIGSLATAKDLVRTRIGSFELKDSLNVSDISSRSVLESIISIDNIDF